MNGYDRNRAACGERSDLRVAHPDVVASMRAAYDAWFTEVTDKSTTVTLDGTGRVTSLQFGNQHFPFREDTYGGPTWVINGEEVPLTEGRGQVFNGQWGDLSVSHRIAVENNRLVMNCQLKNTGNDLITELQAGIRLGVDTYMEKHPDWSERVFPTMLRCEKTHFWGYLMGPGGQILGVSSPDPVASYNILYHEYGHRIYTVRLDFLNPGPLPERHPEQDSLGAGEQREWTIVLEHIPALDLVKPFLSKTISAPMIDCELYTIGDGESFNGTVYGDTSVTLSIQSATGESQPVSAVNGNFHVTPDAGPGIYRLDATSSNGKQTEANLAVRHDWSWYLKHARRNAIVQKQKATSHTESWYGLFAGYLARKHFPQADLDAQIDAVFNEIVPLMYDVETMLPSTGEDRLQNHALMASLLADKYAVSNDIDDLEFAATLADFLMTKQSEDGAYRNQGTHYTSVIYIAKSIMEVMPYEKRLAGGSTPEARAWRERYERHYASVKMAIDELERNLDNIETEGELTYEDGMIACSYTQLAMFALYYATPEDRQKYVDAAALLANGHRCLSQILIPDCRVNGGSLRFWEAQYDVLTSPNMMNSPHGWSGWRIYGLWYLYQLTGNEDYLRQTFNALGACCQLIDFDSSELRWAFVPDPYIKAKVWTQHPEEPGRGYHKDSVIGEQYMPMISQWYRAPDNTWVHGFKGEQDGGCCDNDVHEIFKCLEETILTSAYVVEQCDGGFNAYNCSVSRESHQLIVTPRESVIDAVHVQLKSKLAVTVTFAQGTKHVVLDPGMTWIRIFCVSEPIL